MPLLTMPLVAPVPAPVVSPPPSPQNRGDRSTFQPPPPALKQNRSIAVPPGPVLALPLAIPQNRGDRSYQLPGPLPVGGDRSSSPLVQLPAYPPLISLLRPAVPAIVVPQVVPGMLAFRSATPGQGVLGTTGGTFFFRDIDDQPYVPHVQQLSLISANPPTNNVNATCNFGTDTTQRWFLVTPNGLGVDSGDAGPSPPFAWQNVGWRINAAYFNSLANAQRFIPALAQMQIVCGLIASQAQGSPQTVINVGIWRVAAGGGSAVLIQQGSSTSTQVGTSITTFNILINITGAGQQVNFGAGETLMLEFWIQSVGVAGGQTLSFRIEGNSSPFGTAAISNGPKFQTLYSAALSEAIVMPGDDALVAQQSLARAVADPASAADALATSAGAYARGLADTASGADALTANSVYPRALTDTGPASEVVASVQVLARSLADSATAADFTGRVLTGARALAEIVAGSDVVARAVILARALADTVMGSDAVSTGGQAVARGLTDTAAAADGGVTRVLIAGRAVSDAALATDIMGRVVSAARSLADAATAGCAVARAMAAVRSIADSAPGSDILTRVLMAVRLLSDSAPASDVAMRDPVVRPLQDLPLGATAAEVQSTTTSVTIEVGGATGVEVIE